MNDLSRTGLTTLVSFSAMLRSRFMKLKLFQGMQLVTKQLALRVNELIFTNGKGRLEEVTKLSSFKKCVRF